MYGQERNLGTGKAIRTVVGWGELDYAFDRSHTFIAGYGFDNPLNSDLRGTSAVPDTQYVLNHRTSVTAVRHNWGDLYASFERNHLMTEWSTSEHFAGDNFMISTATTSRSDENMDPSLFIGSARLGGSCMGIAPADRL